MTSNYEKSYYQATNPKKWVSRTTFIIVVITTIVVSFIVYQNIDNIQELFIGNNTENTQEISGLHIWDSVNISGLLVSNGDGILYSHTIDTAKYHQLWLKSRKINLNEYTGYVTLQGEVERLQWSLYIVEVTEISGSKIANSSLWDVTTWEYNSGKYFPQAGIFFPTEFFTQFELLNQGEWGELKVKNLWSNQEITIKYFSCDTTNPSKNCDQLEANFSNAGEKSFQTVNAVVMYKLYEVESRFARSKYRWYFINNVPESEVASLAQYMQVVNDKLIDQTIKPHISTLCRSTWEQMETIQSYTTSKKWDEIILSIDGKSSDGGTISCELTLNPNLVLWATVINISYTANDSIKTWDSVEVESWDINDDKNSDTTDDGTIDLNDLNYDEQIENTETDMNNYTGEQFPINLQKAYTFESRRNYKIIFPSSNISFAGVTVSTDLWEEWVHCFSQMNVVKHGTSDQERDEHPSIKIYECNFKNWFIGSSKYRQIDVWDDRHFIIETVDPARQNFADNVEIE